MIPQKNIVAEIEAAIRQAFLMTLKTSFEPPPPPCIVHRDRIKQDHHFTKSFQMKKENPLTTWRRIILELLWKTIKAIASWLWINQTTTIRMNEWTIFVLINISCWCPCNSAVAARGVNKLINQSINQSRWNPYSGTEIPESITIPPFHRIERELNAKLLSLKKKRKQKIDDLTYRRLHSIDAIPPAIRGSIKHYKEGYPHLY